MKKLIYLIIFFLIIIPLSSNAEYSTDEVCKVVSHNVKYNKINNLEVIIRNTYCGPIVANVTGLPFDINLYFSEYLNIAQIDYKNYKLEQLNLVCRIFSEIDEITINADDFICKS